jgi:diguanylate cyclase (GGDEF)-like protein
VAVLFIDIDNFKRVNSLLGYFGGAELLVQFAQRLREIPQLGLLGHISGDEFVLLLPNMPNGIPNARQAARSIKDALRAPFFVRRRSLSVTVSIGVSVYPKDARTVSELFEHAACAAHVAKRAGKSCYRHFRGPSSADLSNARARGSSSAQSIAKLL